MKVLNTIPIFQRLFLAFLVAGLLPGSIIVGQSYVYQSVLATYHLTVLAGPFLAGTIFAVCLSTLIVIALGYLVNQTITQPLSQLAAIARRISRGETQARAHLKGQDELVLVAASLNLMLEQIEKLVYEAQGQRDALQAQIDQLVRSVSGLGEGDLRVQAEVTTDDLGVLADAFNYMIEELSKLVVRVKHVAKEVEQATVQTSEQMNHLGENAGRQIQQIDLATRQVEAMAQMSVRMEAVGKSLSQSGKETGQAAQHGRNLLQQTSEGIEQMHREVHDTATHVARLAHRSNEINEIVEVIATIAHQTNRLALDAAIQAAMAGENGKGFGAVAADIRRFAERTKEEAHKIARIGCEVREEITAATEAMQETERETDAGASFIRETQQALLTIFQQVEQQANKIEDIHLLVTQQLQLSQTTVSRMQDVADIATQSHQTVRLVMQQMELLTALAHQLQRSVEVFQVRTDLALDVPLEQRMYGKRQR